MRSKRLISVLCLMIILSAVSCGKEGINYEREYEKFIENGLDKLWEESDNGVGEGPLSFEEALLATYLLDLDNDKIPELLAVFLNTYNSFSIAVKKMDKGFVILPEIEFYSVDGGTTQRVYCQILKGADGKIYTYVSSRFKLNDVEYYFLDEDEQIKLFENDASTVVMKLKTETKKCHDDASKSEYKVNDNLVSHEELEQEGRAFDEYLSRFEVLANSWDWEDRMTAV